MRYGWVAGHLPFGELWSRGPRGQKVKNFGNAHLVDPLRDRVAILQDGRSRWVADHLPFWSTLAKGLARPRSKGQRQNFDSKYLENGDSWTSGALIRRTHGLSISTVMFDLG